jgi:hypothetical protein
MRALLVFCVAASCIAASAAPRSRVLLRDFQRLHPCPATEARRGPCPGFQIDHIQPLCAGGQDAIENLQWLDVADHAAKTRKDVAACFGRVYRSPPPQP